MPELQVPQLLPLLPEPPIASTPTSELDVISPGSFFASQVLSSPDQTGAGDERERTGVPSIAEIDAAAPGAVTPVAISIAADALSSMATVLALATLTRKALSSDCSSRCLGRGGEPQPQDARRRPGLTFM